MVKTYLPYEPDQQLLLPAALQEWLPDDHLAYFISDVVDQLDMSKVTARYERERRGGPPYHPRMMVKVLLYGYCVGVACRWSTIMSVVNRSGKMSVHERIDIDPERTGKAPSAQRYPGRSDISG